MIFSRLCFPYPVRICPPHMGTIPVPIEAAFWKLDLKAHYVLLLNKIQRNIRIE